MTTRIVEVTVNQANLTNDYLTLTKPVNEGFFPKSCIGGSSAVTAARNKINLHDNLGNEILTDISDKKKFRARGFINNFFARNNIKAGDIVILEKISDAEYRLTPDEPKGSL